MRSILVELRGTEVEVRQGDSPWVNADEIRRRFKRLADQGVYLKDGRGAISGPFVPDRAEQRIRDGSFVQIRRGRRGRWDDIRLKSPPPVTSSVRCPHCRRIESVRREATQTVVACPNCGQSMKLPPATPAGAPEPSSAAPAAVSKVRSVQTPPPSSEPKRPPAEVTTQPPVHAAGMLQKSAAPNRPTPARRPTVAQTPTVIRDASLPPNPAAPNPYAAPLPATGSGVASPSFKGPSPGDGELVWFMCGSIIVVWGFVVTVATLFRVLALILIAPEIPTDASISPGRLAFEWVQVVGGMLLATFVAAVSLRGGYAMFRRRPGDLKYARLAAIVNAVPCFGCFAFPFAIWALVAVFDSNASRAFPRR